MPAIDVEVEAGQHLVLSPEAPQFREQYRQERPRTPQAARDVIGGLRGRAASARHPRRTRPGSARRSLEDHPEPVDGAEVVSAEELDSPDDAVRTRALRVVDDTLTSYMRGASRIDFAQKEAALVRYLDIIDLTVNVVGLNDLIVADGGVLEIPADTHLVEANRVVIYGTGRIDCTGFKKFAVTSFEGM